MTAWKKPLLSLLARGGGSDPLPSFVRVRSEPNTLVKRGAMQNAYGTAINCPISLSDDSDSVVRAIDLVSVRLILPSVPVILCAGLATRGGHRPASQISSRTLAPSGSDPQLNIL